MTLRLRISRTGSDRDRFGADRLPQHWCNWFVDGSRPRSKSFSPRYRYGRLLTPQEVGLLAGCRLLQRLDSILAEHDGHDQIVLEVHQWGTKADPQQKKHHVR